MTGVQTCALPICSFASDMEKLSKEVLHIEIAQEKGFQERLMKAMDIQRWL